MPQRIHIEDDFHAEFIRNYETVEAALAELHRLSTLTADELADEIGPTPCSGPGLCRRQLQVVADGQVLERAEPTD
jgi:hypothetical protein